MLAPTNRLQHMTLFILCASILLISNLFIEKYQFKMYQILQLQHCGGERGNMGPPLLVK